MRKQKFQEEGQKMIRSINTHFFDGEKFIEYCTEDDFEYPVRLGDKFMIITNDLCIQGVLHDIDVDEKTFVIRKLDGELRQLKCSDVIECEKLD